MTWDEYNNLFHKLELNLVAFKPLMECDHEVLKLVNAAIEAEREACAKVLDDWKKHNWTFEDCAAVIRARRQK